MKRIGLLSFAVVFAFSLNTTAQTISTIAGTGVAGFTGDSSNATAAELFGPAGITIDGAGNTYFSDQDNERIRKISSSGIITTTAGTGTAGFGGDSGLATAAKLNHPAGIALDAAGNIYIADQGNNRIRKINASGIITTIAGIGASGFSGDNGHATAAKLSSPSGVAVDSFGNIYIADRSNARIRKIDTGGMIKTIAGTGLAGYNGDNLPSATLAELNLPTGIVIDRTGNLYIADVGNNRIRKVDTFNKMSTIVGNGIAGCGADYVLGTSSGMNEPSAVALDGVGNVYFIDELCYRIRKLNIASNVIITMAGTGTSGSSIDTGSAVTNKIGDPKGLAVDFAGNIYFTDWSNNKVNHVTTSLGVEPVIAKTAVIKVYPDPNEGTFTVNIESGSNEQAHLVVVNMMGEKVNEINTETNKPILINLDVAPGIYFITATTAQGKWTTKAEIHAR